MAPLLAFLLLLAIASTQAFTNPLVSARSCGAPGTALGVAAEEDTDIRISWDDEDDDEDDVEPEPSVEAARRRRARWEQLDPKYKQYLIKKGQERAVRNKEKTERKFDKKRKLMMFVKEQQKAKKQSSIVQRPLSVGSSERTPLEDVEVGSERAGKVISLTHFGAYVDVGTTCDGLLHVSQLSTEVFVEHPRQLLKPGQEIVVRVRSTNPQQNKMHLTLLPPEVLEEEKREAESADERISLEEIQIDDELWGQLKRVTDFGAYVEVGAACDGWLHFMDHPTWDGSMHPSDFMERGQRVRVWVSDIDRDQNRLKLTANRPAHLPGPRREF